MKKCMSGCGGKMSMKKGGKVSPVKKMKKGGVTQDIVGMPGYNATTRPITMKKGGVTKNAKLAAVAPPRNKVTRADVLTRILKKKKK